MLKIIITGPESTGKSTLSKQLATHFRCTIVNEYSRNYLTYLGRAYTQNDLTLIAKRQIELENNALKTNSDLLIYDTSLEVLKIWSEYKYHSCDKFILDSLTERLPDLYLLMTPDLYWQPDPLRENPLDREELFKLYKKQLEDSTIPFYEISGKWKVRFNMAKTFIETILQS